MSILNKKSLYRWTHAAIACVLSLAMLGQNGIIYAQDLNIGNGMLLPTEGSMVNLTPKFDPLMMKGIRFYPKDALKFDVILDVGDSLHPTEARIKEEGERLVSYFLTGLTVPDEDMWVNLSPYENTRIIPKLFGESVMGSALLGQDYMLKQVMATALYPERTLGKAFWQKIYAESQRRFGTTQMAINTFNKVWIMPDKAVVYSNPKMNAVFVAQSSLKVMLEQDYLAENRHKATQEIGLKEDTASQTAGNLSKAIIKEIVIPALEREVNEGQTFAPLRQVYNALILAKWYKNNLRQNALARGYVNQNKISGVDNADKNLTSKIYHQYLRSYRKGVYNYIKEDTDPQTHTTTPRKYFSGGFNAAMMSVATTTKKPKLGKFLLLIPVTALLLGIVSGTASARDLNEVDSGGSIEKTLANMQIPNPHQTYLEGRVRVEHKGIQRTISHEDAQTGTGSKVMPGDKVFVNIDSQTTPSPAPIAEFRTVKKLTNTFDDKSHNYYDLNTKINSLTDEKNYTGHFTAPENHAHDLVTLRNTVGADAVGTVHHQNGNVELTITAPTKVWKNLANKRLRLGYTQFTFQETTATSAGNAGSSGGDDDPLTTQLNKINNTYNQASVLNAIYGTTNIPLIESQHPLLLHSPDPINNPGTILAALNPNLLLNLNPKTLNDLKALIEEFNSIFEANLKLDDLLNPKNPVVTITDAKKGLNGQRIYNRTQEINIFKKWKDEGYVNFHGGQIDNNSVMYAIKPIATGQFNIVFTITPGAYDGLTDQEKENRLQQEAKNLEKDFNIKLNQAGTDFVSGKNPFLTFTVATLTRDVTTEQTDSESGQETIGHHIENIPIGTGLPFIDNRIEIPDTSHEGDRGSTLQGQPLLGGSHFLAWEEKYMELFNLKIVKPNSPPLTEEEISHNDAMATNARKQKSIREMLLAKNVSPENGGIDLEKIDIQGDTSGVRTGFSDAAQLAMLMHTQGLVPMVQGVFQMTPKMINALLGNP